jgi:hypothetical protein
MRYVAHDPMKWGAEFETYARIRYAWTLGAEWPRLAMVQALLGQLSYIDPVVDDWAHIAAPTLLLGGAEDSLPGSAALFQEQDEVRRGGHPEPQRPRVPDTGRRPRAAH